MATTGPIEAAPSTSNWQMANSEILERVRAELQRERGDTPLMDEAWRTLVPEALGELWGEAGVVLA